LDIPSIKMSGEGLNLKCGHSVMYLCEDRFASHYGQKPVNSIVRVSVGGIVWRDPWLSTDQYYEIFEHCGVGVQIFDGHQMLYTTDVGPLYPTPVEGFYRRSKRAEVSVYRALIVSKGNQVTRREWTNTVPREVREFPDSGLAMRHRHISPNKGLPLGKDDVEFLDPNLVWGAEKCNGVAAMILHSAGALEVVVEGRKPFKFKNYTSGYKKDFILQAEAMTYGDGTEELVVLDVLVAPWGSCGNFISRWRWLENLVSDVAKRWPFRLQQWYRIDDPYFQIVCRGVDEGIVIQSLTAPPSSVTLGAGSARYVKKRWTVERLVDGKIWECTLDGEKLRIREDRKRPNPPHVVQRIRDAMTLDSFQSLMGYYIPQFRETVMESIRALIDQRIPIDSWPKPARIWLWYSRGNPWLEGKCGHTLVQSYRMSNIESLSKVVSGMVTESEVAALALENYCEGLDFSIDLEEPTFHPK